MTQTSTYETLRSMKGRGRPVLAPEIRKDDVVRCDGVKYRVMADPTRADVTGSLIVEVYSEDNQHDRLYLGTASKVSLLGRLDG